MIETLLFLSTCTLLVCSIASILAGVAWMRYDQEQSQIDAIWPTDGITKEPKQ